MSQVRRQRLENDFERLKMLAGRSQGRIEIESRRGDPPEDYVLVLRCRSLERIENGLPVFRDTHKVRIVLMPDYPSVGVGPRARMMTPVFHPHIFSDGHVCMGSVVQTSEFLDDFVLRLGEILRFRPDLVDPTSAARTEAMAWALGNMRLFPTDAAALDVTPEPEPALSWRNL
jgi:ubiquitin-protein ligase